VTRRDLPQALAAARDGFVRVRGALVVFTGVSGLDTSALAFDEPAVRSASSGPPSYSGSSAAG